MTEALTLIAGGRRFDGWTSIRCGRSLERIASDFDISVTEGFLSADGGSRIPPLLPFTPVQVLIGGDLALTGYVDDYAPSFDDKRHDVRVSGRSRTAQLCDVTPLIQSGQFTGNTVSAIAKAVAALFAIPAVVDAPGADQVVPDATYQPCETAFEFLDRLFAVAGVLAIDDEAGQLLVTTAGATRCSTHLQQGVNIFKASAVISGADRFSLYVVKGQAGLSAGLGAVATGQVAQVADATVPLYRPRVWIGETSSGEGSLQTQAQWRANYAIGRSAKAEIVVKGFRQVDGRLWRINEVVTLTAPYLGVDGDLLIIGVDFELSDAGETTTLTIAPIQAASPNPHDLRRHKRGRKGKCIGNWDGAGGF